MTVALSEKIEYPKGAIEEFTSGSPVDHRIYTVLDKPIWQIFAKSI